MKKSHRPPREPELVEPYDDGFRAFGRGEPQKAPVPKVSGRLQKLRIMKAWLRGWRAANAMNNI